jgi:hypothetical protein
VEKDLKHTLDSTHRDLLPLQATRHNIMILSSASQTLVALIFELPYRVPTSRSIWNLNTAILNYRSNSMIARLL